MLKLNRDHLAGSDGWLVAAATRLQIFFKLFQRLVDALAVGVSDTSIAPDKRGSGNGFGRADGRVPSGAMLARGDGNCAADSQHKIQLLKVISDLVGVAVLVSFCPRIRDRFRW